jgi:hypothetical protein
MYNYLHVPFKSYLQLYTCAGKKWWTQSARSAIGVILLFSRLYDVSIFLRPFRHYAIFLLQLFLSVQYTSCNTFSPNIPLIPSTQVKFGLPLFLLSDGRHSSTPFGSLPSTILYIHTQRVPKLYTHFKKGKNCIKTVTLYIYIYIYIYITDDHKLRSTAAITRSVQSGYRQRLDTSDKGELLLEL